MSEIRHVVHRDNGGWAVVADAQGAPAPNGNGTSTLFKRRREAEAHARDIVRQHGGGEVLLHTPSGEIVETSVVLAEEPISAT
jgi:hypothetical protein